MAGFPDDQAIVEWLGPVLATGTDVVVPAIGGLTLGPYTTTTYSYFVAAFGGTVGSLTATITQSRSNTSANVSEIDVWPIPDSSAGMRPLALHGDTVTVDVRAASPPGLVSYAFYWGNTPPSDTAAISDTLPAIDVPASAGMLWNGTAFVLPRTPSVYGRRADAAVVAGTPFTLIAGTLGTSLTLLSAELSMSVAGQLLLKEGGVEWLRSPQLPAGGIWKLDYRPGGYRGFQSGNAVQVDVSVNANVGGWAGATRE